MPEVEAAIRPDRAASTPVNTKKHRICLMRERIVGRDTAGNDHFGASRVHVPTYLFGLQRGRPGLAVNQQREVEAILHQMKIELIRSRIAVDHRELNGRKLVSQVRQRCAAGLVVAEDESDDRADELSMADGP